MRTALEIAQAKDILQRASDGAAARAKELDGIMLRMFVDLLKWVQGDPSAFERQLEIIRKRVMNGVN